MNTSEASRTTNNLIDCIIRCYEAAFVPSLMPYDVQLPSKGLVMDPYQVEYQDEADERVGQGGANQPDYDYRLESCSRHRGTWDENRGNEEHRDSGDCPRESGPLLQRPTDLEHSRADTVARNTITIIIHMLLVRTLTLHAKKVCTDIAMIPLDTISDCSATSVDARYVHSSKGLMVCSQTTGIFRSTFLSEERTDAKS